MILTARITPPSSGTGFMSFSVSGATSLSADDARALIRQHGSSSSTGSVQASAVFHLSGLNAGSHTFTAQYRAGSSSSTAFENRSIIVIPLP